MALPFSKSIRSTKTPVRTSPPLLTIASAMGLAMTSVIPPRKIAIRLENDPLIPAHVNAKKG
jgi:hypothetical protein